MRLFSKSDKPTTLVQAVRANDVRAARKMLADGADPNKCEANDSEGYPIFYALHSGPEMVQVLIDHGADVNTSGRRNVTPLATAQFRGLSEIATILRKAGGQLVADNETYLMDPIFRLKITPRIAACVLAMSRQFPNEGPEAIADRVDPLLKYDLPAAMPAEQQAVARRDIRRLILAESLLIR